MEKVRVIKRKDGVIQTQHRSDEHYDDNTLPADTSPGDVEAQLVVDAAELAGVEDVQTQVDLLGGRLVKDLTRTPPVEQRAGKRAAATAVLCELETDCTLPAALRRYLIALRDALDLGPSQLVSPQPPRRRR